MWISSQDKVRHCISEKGLLGLAWRACGGLGRAHSVRKAPTEKGQGGVLQQAADSGKGLVWQTDHCIMLQDWRCLLRTASHIWEGQQSTSPQEHCYGNSERGRAHKATQPAGSTQDTVFQQLGPRASAKKKAEPVLNFRCNTQKRPICRMDEKWTLGPRNKSRYQSGTWGQSQRSSKAGNAKSSFRTELIIPFYLKSDLIVEVKAGSSNL